MGVTHASVLTGGSRKSATVRKKERGGHKRCVSRAGVGLLLGLVARTRAERACWAGLSYFFLNKTFSFSKTKQTQLFK